jgi:membrane fusion protein (multidrug efflux system)
VAAVAGGTAWGAHWWSVGRFVQSTDDAYVAADQVVAAPRVSGYVSAVLVRDDQEVAEGQPLVRIDPANYDATLARQRATVAARAADVATAEAQLRQQSAAVAEAAARLDGARADARFASGEAERYRKLSKSGAETAENIAKADNERDRANAAVCSDEAALEAERRRVDTLAA